MHIFLTNTNLKNNKSRCLNYVTCYIIHYFFNVSIFYYHFLFVCVKVCACVCMCVYPRGNGKIAVQIAGVIGYHSKEALAS